MNKLLKGSIVLVLFSMAIGIFQMCSKENVIAQAASYVLPIATTTTLGGVIPDGTSIAVDGTGKISNMGSQQQNKIIFATKGNMSALNEIWIANYDGTNMTKVTVPTLPQAQEFDFNSISISPDGKTIFIAGLEAYGNRSRVYSMTSSGTEIKLIIDYDGYTASGAFMADMKAF